MHEKAAFVFWSTLILYGITLATVSYVGVYLTYVAIPLIVLSGLVMILTKHKTKGRNILGKTTSAIKGALDTTNHLLTETSSALDGFNKSLDVLNKKNELIRERTRSIKNDIHAIKLNRSKVEINVKYAKSDDETKEQKKIIIKLNNDISLLENKIKDIEKECELEALQDSN